MNQGSLHDEYQQQEEHWSSSDIGLEEITAAAILAGAIEEVQEDNFIEENIPEINAFDISNQVDADKLIEKVNFKSGKPTGFAFEQYVYSLLKRKR